MKIIVKSTKTISFDGQLDSSSDSENQSQKKQPTPIEELVKRNSDVERINDGYLSLEDIAKDKNVSVATVKRWRNDGRVKKVK